MISRIKPDLCTGDTVKKKKKTPLLTVLLLGCLTETAFSQNVGLEFDFQGGKNRDVLLMEFTNMRTQPSYCPPSVLYQ